MREAFGDSYIEADFAALDKLLGELGKTHYVDVGILGENAQKTSEGGETIGSYGAKNEFGSVAEHIPKRSFIQMPIETRQSQIQAEVEPRMAKHLQAGDVAGIFVDIGISAEGVIQDAFDTHGFGTWKPNAERTIEMKTIRGRPGDSPLIDTGALRKSISSKAGEA